MWRKALSLSFVTVTSFLSRSWDLPFQRLGLFSLQGYGGRDLAPWQIKTFTFWVVSFLSVRNMHPSVSGLAGASGWASRVICRPNHALVPPFISWLYCNCDGAVSQTAGKKNTQDTQPLWNIPQIRKWAFPAACKHRRSPRGPECVGYIHKLNLDVISRRTYIYNSSARGALA